LLSVFLLVTAFIVYGSLYPWQFRPALIPGNPLWILLHSWYFALNRYFIQDTGVNLILYLPFGATCYLWLARRPAWLKLTAPLILALLLSCSMEMLQLYDAQRFCSMLDVVTNFTGAALGVAIAWRFQHKVLSRPRSAGPLMLLCCWLAALLFPFMPDLSPHHFLYKLSTFTSPPFSPLAFVNAFVMWLAAARLLEAVYPRALTPLLLLELPARLLVSGLTLTWTDCLPAVAAMMIWLFWNPRARYRDATLGVLSLTSILLTGLSPFHFSPVAQGFSWVPFKALFSANWEVGSAIFFRKCFTYGSSIWLLSAAGFNLILTSAGVAILLAAIEVIQLWLPNHVSESTDPLLALILAWMLNHLTMKRPPAHFTSHATHTPSKASVRL
jgi:glycopeptide antibiotics resistance protein